MFTVSQVLLQVSARGLKISKTPDRQLSTRCTLLISNGSNDSFVETDKTEFNDECLNPDWDKKFMIAFKFTEIQNLRFDIYKSVDKIGETKILLSELVSSKDGFTMKTIKSSENEKIGKLLISYFEVESTKQTILMQFNGKNLDKKDLFGLSDPYLVISNIDRNGNLSEVYKSEVKKQTICPVWEPIKIRAKTLCNSDNKMKLQFDVYDWDSDIKVDFSDNIDFIGSFTTTLEELLNGPSDQNNYQLINANKLAQNLDSYKNSGLICLQKISITLEESFLDYLRNGLQFHLKFAIDFSSLLQFKQMVESNQCNSSNVENIFNLFVKSFAQIIEPYNRQNLWTASGFNAIFADNDTNNYEFIATENLNSIFAEIESKLGNIKPMTKLTSNKSSSIEMTINQSIEWIESIIKSESNMTSRYFILLVMTSQLNKENLKTLDNIIDKTHCKPMSIIVFDFNTYDNNKEIKEISRLMNEKKKLFNRKNIEIISVQNLLQNNNWQILANKTVRDIVSRIPDHFMNYLKIITQK